MDVGLEIANARRAAGLTQAELAQRAGTSQAALSAYESGRKDPSTRTFLRLLGAAGWTTATVRMPAAVRFPGAQERVRRGRILAEVMELAEALPVRYSSELRYPPLATLPPQVPS